MINGWWERLSAAICPDNRGKKPLPQSKNNRYQTTKFLFRSDWTLAASGGARFKLRPIRTMN